MSNILIVAGEPSGDVIGGPLVEELARLRPELSLWGYGGEEMRSAGMETLTGVEELAVMGFVNVVGRLPEMFRRIRELAEEAKNRNADGAVLIDYPGFNIRLAKKLTALGIPVVYYVSPQVWAWKPGRVEKLKRAISKMLVILPFEEEIYRKVGVPVSFVGHHFVDNAAPTVIPENFRREHGLSEPLLLLLPGSREQEVSRLLGPMIEAYRMLREEIPGLNGLIVRAPSLPEKYFNIPEIPGLKTITGHSIDAMFASTAALCCSGSATLQCAATGLPHVITYRTDPLSAFIYRRLLSTKMVGLSNLVAGSPVSEELLQGDATASKLAGAVKPLLIDGKIKVEKIAELARIKAKLGEPGAALRAAREVISIIYGL